MNTKSKINTKPIMSLVLLSYIFLFTSQANEQDNIFVEDCIHYGTVLDFSDIRCGYQIILDNGTLLRPVNESVPDYFSDSIRVRVAYEVIDSFSNECGNGLLVYLSCCHQVDDPFCEARFEFYALDYAIDIANGPISSIYTFVDVSVGNVVQRNWIIDGDSISNDSIVTYHFYHPGVHTVCLAINTAEGCYDISCEEIPGPGNCSAYFTYERMATFTTNSTLNNKCLVPTWDYHFHDQSVGDVISWNWQFGSDTIQGLPDLIYSFPGPGVYDVCLTIETSDSCSSTYCETVYVVDSSDCKAMFSYYNPLDSPVYENDFVNSKFLQFIDQSEGNITHWYWDFGDSTSSVEQNPLHEFPEAGVYYVCLTVASPDDCQDTYCTEVIVGSPVNCNAYFEYCNYSHLTTNAYSDDSLYVVGFKNFSTPEPFYSRWNFGDGTYSSEMNPVHIYNVPGMYEVCLSIYTEFGCEDTYCARIKVGNVQCSVDFTWDLWVPDCSGYEIAHLFTPVLEGEVWSYYWDFGDGHFSNDPTVAHIYTNEGYYDVCLEVYYKNQCAARECKTVFVAWDNRDSIIYNKCNPNVLDPNQLDQELSVLKVFPNPASDRMVVELFSDEDKELVFQLVGILGNKVKIRKVLMASTGKNQFEVQLNDVEAGSYIYLISSSDKIVRGRVAVVK
jgi:PKD repeat protein